MSEVRAVCLQLYGTVGCHLCEEAELVVLPWAYALNLKIVVVDIAEGVSAETLIQRYGLRIPVVVCGDAELSWPFDELQLELWWQAQRLTAQ